ncbi:secreted protein containing C-type lectin domain protein [Candidatus Magnetomorum sp. HK-1]|nr:secreted protein containing C-type lectin domain protein [Candidatus Magnetomorum sp. HK-1]
MQFVKYLISLSIIFFIPLSGFTQENILEGKYVIFEGEFFQSPEGNAFIPEDSQTIITDGIFFNEHHHWASGPVWWRGADSKIIIYLGESYLINSIKIQADCNDTYRIYFHAPNEDDGTWLQLYDTTETSCPGLGTSEYQLPNFIEIDAFRIQATDSTGDLNCAVGEFQAFGILQKLYDSDNDGVPDSKDDCPNTGSNVWVNNSGCPDINKGSEIKYNSDNGHYYQRFEFNKTSWTNAKQFCEQRGGYLATITSENEQLFITNNFSNKYWLWLGGTDESNEGSWEWITGEDWVYTNWHQNEPSGGTEHYLNTYYFPDGTWNDNTNNGADNNIPLCEWNSLTDFCSNELNDCNYLLDGDNDGVIDLFDQCMSTPPDSWINKHGCRGELHYTQEQMNQVINNILGWDKNKDGNIGLVEAINILQNAAGVPIPNSGK